MSTMRVKSKRIRDKPCPRAIRTLDEVLTEAVEYSDSAKVRMALKLGATARKEHLLLAVERAKKDFIKLTVGPGRPGSKDFTEAMSKKVVMNGFDVIRLLLASGTFPYSLDVKQTCLAASINVAVELQHRALVEFFLENEKSKWIFEPRTGDGRSPLHLMGNNLDIANLLISHSSLKPSDIDAQDYDGRTPFHIACRDGHFEVGKLLLANGAYPFLNDNYEWSPLHHAIANGHYAIADWLIKKVGTIRNYTEQLPLFHAVGLDRPVDLNLLTQLAIDPFHPDEEGNTALLIMEKKIRNHHPVPPMCASFLEELIDTHPGIVNIPNRDGITALHAFATHSEVFLPVFGSVKADLMVSDRYGRNPLTKAVIASSAQGVTHLTCAMTKKKLDLELGDCNGWTALHWASFLSLRQNGTRIVQTLVQQGANVNATNKHKRTPLHLVGYKRMVYFCDLTRYGDHTIDHLLRYPGKTVSSPGEHLPVVNALLDRGASPVARDQDGNLPFFTVAAGYLVAETYVILRKAAEGGLFDQLLRRPLS